MRYSSDIGFFLDISRFYSAFSAQDPGVRPLDALINAILLWGSHLSDASDTNTYEANFLALAVRDAAQGLASGHPQAVMHCIQAEVLLSHYFHQQSRSLEGKYHACVAVSLVLSSRLHKIRSADASSDITSLPPPLDAVDEGQRINGFWTVFILSNCWAAIEGSPSSFQFTSSSPEARIDLPWPLDIGSYSQVKLYQMFCTKCMSDGFYRCHGHKILALATRLSSSWKTNMTAVLPPWRCTPKLLFYSNKLLGLYQHIEQVRFCASMSGVDTNTSFEDMSQQQASQFFASYNMTQTIIEKVLAALPSPVTPEAIVTQSLVHGAMISLYAPFLSQNPASRGRLAASMRALEALVLMMDVPNLPVIDSIVGVRVSPVSFSSLPDETSLDDLGACMPSFD